MELHVYDDKGTMGQAAAEMAAKHINNAIDDHGEASIILATGASQFEMLEALVRQPVQWNKVTAFHLDEYIGLPRTHPASFRRYLEERFQRKVEGLKEFHFVNGDADNPAAECARLHGLIMRSRIAVACVGIGENGHLAFNDPPADIDTTDSYIVVDLDEQCRHQQLGEGWFDTIDYVPTRAITMTIHRILSSGHIVCTVPDRRKAQALKDTMEHEVSETVPASLLRTHVDCHVFADKPAASLLERKD
ncbi:MAG: glucosamine-6-phosphate deaminase [Chitinivibrionales bacterium]|nr:glucosamine-6-phosphate deaminase [Chitinivibrionales bacterium]